jgi:hypothetical protein
MFPTKFQLFDSRNDESSLDVVGQKRKSVSALLDAALLGRGGKEDPDENLDPQLQAKRDAQRKLMASWDDEK